MHFLRLYSVPLYSVVALLSIAGPLMAGPQKAPPSAALATQPDYSGESLVIERLDQVYAMNSDGTGYRETTVVVRVQSDAAVRQVGVIAVPFASASERVEFKYARVRRSDGSVIDTPVSDAIEQPEQVTVQAPFYSDLKQEQLPVKSLRVGDTLEWQARVVRTKSEAPGEFWGEHSFVTEGGIVLAESLELRVPAATRVTVWTNPAAGITPVESVAGDQRIYRWTHANLKPTIGPAAEAEKKARETRFLTTDEIVDAEQGKLPSVAWTTFSSWAAVGAWYRGLEADRVIPDSEIKSKVAELTAGKTTDEEKVRAVYAYVSTQIRYIGVDFGVGRYQPHRADEVLENQYGDCKDKHTLLAAMLTALALHPDTVLIGAGIRFNTAVPSPAVFNHLITRVQVGGQEVWLDTTAEVAPYRMLVLQIRDKPALVVPDTGPTSIERTPADLPFASFQDWVADGSLNTSGVSDSHIALTLRGDAELFFRQVLRQVAPAQYDEFVQKLLQGIGYQGTSSHAQIGRPDDPSTPLVIKFDYHREQAGDWPNRRIIPQLAPVDLPMVDDKQPPVAPIELNASHTETSTAELKLPDGWGVELPEAVHEKSPWATYDLTYRFDKGTLYSERRVVVLQKKVPAEQWTAYKKWQDAISLGNETYVQLIHTGFAPDAHEGNAAAPGPADAKAETLIQQAMTALQHLDDAKASALLDQAKALNAQQVRLWAAYGALAFMRGEKNEALKDYERELDLHPESYFIYGAMAQMQRMAGDKAAAEATLQRWVAADGHNSVAAAQLINLLIEDGKTAEAAAAAEAAFARIPADQLSDQSLQLAAGQAEMKAGKDAKAEAIFLSLLTSSDQPSTLNTAAYLLSDADKDLSVAEASEHKALEKLETETQSWTLDEDPQLLSQRTYLLVASWDTMGWILFREGKLKQAESYAEAAWLNGQRDDVGEHLVRIRAAIANPQKASELEKATTGGSKVANPDPGKSKQDLRTIPLGPAGGRNGVAEYRLLMSHGRVESVRPTGTNTIDRAAELLETAKLLNFFPEDSSAKLVRNAMLNCYSGRCYLVFVP